MTTLVRSIHDDMKPTPSSCEASGSLVVAPHHYNNHPSGIECRDIIRHEPYNIASAIKYIHRRHDKGQYDLDLDKAIECLQDQADNQWSERTRYDFNSHPSGIDLNQYIRHEHPDACDALNHIFSRHDYPVLSYRQSLLLAISYIHELKANEGAE